MSAKQNVKATRAAALNTGSEVEVASLTIVAGTESGVSKKTARAKKATPSKSTKPKKQAAKPVRANAKTGKTAAAKKPKNTKAAAPKAPRSASTEERLHVSTAENPVALMWDLCQKMKNSRRKDVIAEAQRHGIAFYTARTQYQLWLTASRNSK